MSDEGRVVLVGPSLFGSRAISRLGLSCLLVCDTSEDPAMSLADAESVVRLPYRGQPDSLASLPRPPDARAVVSFTEYGLLPAAELARAWSVGGVPVAAVRNSRDKLLMRQALADAGYPVPFGPLRAAADIPSGSYPVIVKPAHGVAGVGVRLAAGPGDLADVAAEVAAGRGPLMWERYLAGSEFSVETITAAGRHSVLGITQKVTTGPPHFVEQAHFAPAALSPQATAQLTECVADCLDAIGLTVGPAHTEVVLGSGGATVVETHTRPGGGRIPLITELACGLDQYELAVRALCGLPLPTGPGRMRQPGPRAAGVRFLRIPPGVLAEVTGMEAASALEGVVEVCVERAIGTRANAWRDNLDRGGFAVCQGRDLIEVRERLETVAAAISFRVDGDCPGGTPLTCPSAPTSVNTN
jgi:biotin carboxylase